ncbi:acyl-CoA thioester hydrolase [Desulfacinum hydrothermale DSM 13146]|uniref:Acyl-CoA thioester hydrolase n=1 Tax=Desulfacinum hydrothermale DSM 13146 TaxID=1121390 RepID=A0A1W1WY46_9BACT|nr:thioesterase family protein [Desulfacinum hydrothermale]SMC16585.1 acyl-CoA thioester hydrolase [Desulfacinum hydrothermale DSM 13146]
MEEMRVQGPWFHHWMRVPLYEVDLGQGVYHGNYFHLFERGREAFFRKLGFPYRRLMDQGMHLTVAELQCHYLKSLHYDERIRVGVAIVRLGRRSLSLAHTIQRIREDGIRETTTRAVLHLVCVGASGPLPLPQAFADALRRWMQSGLIGG